MKPFRLFLVALAALLLATPSNAQKLSLAAISAYLQSIDTAQAPFTQINDDGTISTGEIFIRRPGRVRFEYNPPDESLVMAGQGQVAVFDAKSNQPPTRFPLVKTPLYLILAKDINLSQDKMVVAHTSDANTTTVTAQDPKHPDYGNIQLVFTGDPVELRQWIVTDGTGQRTTVILGQMTLGGRLRTSLFNIEDEMKTRGF
jgi:outer membrane lipoprotein-sorting protein